jgi:nucleotide-binding universal stress UspA family protein
MNAIKRILVPTDFSAHADEAFRAAHTLARATGAEVVVFHVARPPPSLPRAERC